MDIQNISTNEYTEIICEKCGCNKSKIIYSIGPKGKLEGGECVNCGALTYKKWVYTNDPNILLEVKCPFCQSANVKKISGASKAASAIAFGVFALGKITKTWHCNNCGSNFG